MKKLGKFMIFMSFFAVNVAGGLGGLAYAAETVEVRIIKMQFEPAEIKVKAGDTVKWVSYEKRGYHTVWFRDEGLPESTQLFMDESTTRTFDKAGRFPYECGSHPQMKGVVIVE